MTEAIGPIFAAGFQTVTKNGYPLLFLPDANNDQLQREGKAPVYHWLPNSVRLAQKPDGYYKFSFLQFAGIRDEETHVGVSGHDEVVGALCGFSTTSSPPPDVLQQASDELINRFRGNSDYYWGWRSPATPQIRPAPIVSNTMTITQLSPNGDGSMPSVATGGGAGPGGGAPPGGGRSADRNRAPSFRLERPRALASPRSFSLDRAMRGSNLDAWYCNLDGAGPGSVTPFAENAFSGIVGAYPAAMIYANFHGGMSAITVWQFLQLKVWSPVVEINIVGDWSRIQDHFSAAASAGGWFWSADIKAEFNSMQQNGTIVSEIKVDETLPNADKIREQMEKRSDLVFQKFMDQAQKVIFDPAPFNEKPAEASGGFLGFGGGVAVKLRRDRVDLHLEFHERRQMAYLQQCPISGQLEGVRDHILADPSAEKRYFQSVDMGDLGRKVTRAIKPVINWPDPTRNWVGQPVSFLSAQVGYPNAAGELQWAGHMFQAADGADAKWTTSTTMKKKDEVANPPAGWEPDRTFVKRSVHFGEPPNETENPFVRVSIEKNVVDLDPGESGVPLNDINLEVRVDNVGGINCGPIFLNVDLETEKQIVEVTFQADGKTADGNPRPPVKFSWNFNDQREPRYWMVYTGDPAYLPKFKYQVHVLVKGSIFTRGQEWTGPWVDASGNGPIMLSVPTPQDEGVVTRELVIPMLGAPASANGAVAGKPPASVAGKPPGSKDLAGDKKPAPAKEPMRAGGWSLEPPATGARSATGASSRPPATASARNRKLSGNGSNTRALEDEGDGWTTLTPTNGEAGYTPGPQRQN